MNSERLYYDFDKFYLKDTILRVFNEPFFIEWLSREHCKFLAYGLEINLSNRDKWLKKEMIEIFFMIFTKKNIFDSFVTIIDKPTFNIMVRISWYGDVAREEVNISSAWSWLFRVTEKYLYIYNLPDLVKESIKSFISPPSSFSLNGQENPGHTEFKFICEQSHTKDILTFIQAFHQNSVNFTIKGIPRHSDLKALHKKAPYKEFYPLNDKDIPAYHRAYCVFAYLNCFVLGKQPSDIIDPVDFIKESVEYPVHKKSSSDMPVWTSHLRGNDNYTYIENPSLEIMKLFKCLPRKKWVSIEDLVGWTTVRKKSIKIQKHNYMYFKKYSGYYNDRISINDNNRNQLLILPLLKAKSFLFASLGLLDIAYDAPRNDYYRSKGKPYLTVFDGLSWIRVTPLGEYVLGIVNKKPDIEIVKSEVELDENILVATLKSFDPVKQFFLDSIGIKISKRQYKVDRSSLIKDCKSLSDLINKKKIFLETIDSKPPEKWILLFEDAIQKFNILQSVNYEVFQIKKDIPLLQIIKSNPDLSNIVKFAEGGFVIIAKENIRKVRLKLKVLGYYF